MKTATTTWQQHNNQLDNQQDSQHGGGIIERLGRNYVRNYSWLYNFSLFCSSGTYFDCMYTSTEITMVKLQFIANFHKSTIDGPQTQFNHGFQCFTRLHQPQDEQIICSYGTCIFQPCMRIGWVLQASPSNPYWWRYEVGQWLVFGWFWGWGTSDTWLGWKLGKINTPQPWWPPLLYGHHGLPPLVPLHITISQHAVQQVYVVKTKEHYCCYYLLAM